MPNAGQIIKALDFTGFASDAEAATGTTTSTSYTATLTSGTACAVTFVAPTSGQVRIINTATMFNSTTAQSRMSFRLGTGSTPGGGTEVLAANNARALRFQGTNENSASFGYTVTGLTAGATYNVQQQFAVSSASTGTFAAKQLTVIPLPG